MGYTFIVLSRRNPPDPAHQKKRLMLMESAMAKSRLVSTVVESTPEIKSVLEQVLRIGVRIPHPESVADYLQQHPDLLALLVPIASTIVHSLPDATLSLELYVDPEVDDKYLTIYARFDQYDESTMARIDAACGAFEPLLERTRSWILLTTDFKPPE
jgi:hypothetical protein